MSSPWTPVFQLVCVQQQEVTYERSAVDAADKVKERLYPSIGSRRLYMTTIAFSVC